MEEVNNSTAEAAPRNHIHKHNHSHSQTSDNGQHQHQHHHHHHGILSSNSFLIIIASIICITVLVAILVLILMLQRLKSARNKLTACRESNSSSSIHNSSNRFIPHTAINFDSSPGTIQMLVSKQSLKLWFLLFYSVSNSSSPMIEVLDNCSLHLEFITFYLLHRDS